ncbi:hypothetical protein AN216_19375 [Streptomyces oceani]|uniref:Uncharacterized protein n=1 Tax=Streptomyces oceani TaxID=1075402 RepID=A0A1E7JY43_9ACTN|nr:hypothetical protein AN216_19375 [Streptomyces oceani]
MGDTVPGRHRHVVLPGRGAAAPVRTRRLGPGTTDTGTWEETNDSAHSTEAYRPTAPRVGPPRTRRDV